MAEKSRLNVLVVDRDEATDLELKDYLTEQGYRVQSHTHPDAVVGGDQARGLPDGARRRVAAGRPRARAAAAGSAPADSDMCVVAMTAMPSVDARCAR